MLRRLNDVDYEVETPGRCKETKIFDINLFKKWNDPQVTLLAVSEGETEQHQVAGMDDPSGEGVGQGEPLQVASDLKEELYPFDSDITEIELSPELTPNLDASQREDLHTLISQFP